MNENNTYYPANTFGKQHTLNYAANERAEQDAALRYLDKHAPDLVGMIMGHVL